MKKQLDVFDAFEHDNCAAQMQKSEFKQIPDIKVWNDPFIIEKYHKYDLEKYKQDVINIGLKETWANCL